jgi:hypothetical protein
MALWYELGLGRCSERRQKRRGRHQPSVPCGGQADGVVASPLCDASVKSKSSALWTRRIEYGVVGVLCTNALFVLCRRKSFSYHIYNTFRTVVPTQLVQCGVFESNGGFCAYFCVRRRSLAPKTQNNVSALPTKPCKSGLPPRKTSDFRTENN